VDVQVGEIVGHRPSVDESGHGRLVDGTYVRPAPTCSVPHL
jgi:hypothetical protein